MSYLVLARKYRPRSFGTLVGQEHVVQALVNALTRQRLHHAYLFAGTRGVGKTTVSRVLAKALNCTGADGQGGITAEPCGACAPCRDIDSGRFVDYVELDAASNRGVDEITQLLDQAVYKPVTGRFKVYMIDEVHMLSNHAFNAMLKTLEEPPEYLKFVLATTDPQKVPPTVLSRCLQFNLRPMAPQTIEAHLREVLEAESVASEPAALRLLARAARGSMRDALSLADQAIAYGAGSLGEASVRQMLGAVDRSHAVRLLGAIAAGDGPGLVEAAGELRGLGLSAAGTLEEMAELLQQIAIAKAVPQALDESAADSAAVRDLAARIAADEVQLFYGMCLHGRAELALAPDEHSGLVMVLLRMLAFRPEQLTATPPLPESRPAHEAAVPHGTARATPLLAQHAATASVPARLPTGAAATGLVQPATDAGSSEDAPALAENPRLEENGSASQPASDAGLPAAPDRDPAELGNASQPQAGADTDLTAARGASDLGDRWNRVVTQLSASGRIGALTRELALQSQCVEIEAAEAGAPAVWRLCVERESLRSPAHIDKLEKAVAEHLGEPVRIQVDVGCAVDSPALRAAAERRERQAEAERTIGEDPVVRALLQQFKTARIVPGSVRPC